MRTLAVAVLAVSVLGVSPASAQPRPINEGGDARPCVTMDEFRAVHSHMPRNRVQRIIDTDGHRGSRHDLDSVAGTLEHTYGGTVNRGKIVRVYPACGADGALPVATPENSGPPVASGRVWIEYTGDHRMRVRFTYLDGADSRTSMGVPTRR